MEYILCDEDIKGKKYIEFVKYCLEQTTYFSVTYHGEGKGEENDILSEIQMYACKSLQTYTWYNYKTYLHPLSVFVYYSSPEILEWFEKHFHCLFDVKVQGIEDICFFKENKLLFGSVSHEKMAQLFLTSDTEISDYEKFAKWKKVFIEQDREYIPDLEM